MRSRLSQISDKTFVKTLRGYDPVEVQTYLRRISEELEKIVDERDGLRLEVKKKQVELQDYHERDQLLRNTIANATKMTERLRSDAGRESKLILIEAHQKAEAIVRDAKSSLSGIYKQISQLKQQRMQFESNLKALVKSHLSMLDQSKNFFSEPEVPKSFEQSQMSDHKRQSLEDKVKDLLDEKIPMSGPEMDL